MGHVSPVCPDIPMNKPKKLTDYTIVRLTPADRRYDVKDHVIPQLYLTVHPTGSKSWVYRYRADGKSKRYRIGDGSVSPDKARRAARKVAGDLASDIDANDVKQQRRREQDKAKNSTLRKFIVSPDYKKTGKPTAP